MYIFPFYWLIRAAIHKTSRNGDQPVHWKTTAYFNKFPSSWKLMQFHLDTNYDNTLFTYFATTYQLTLIRVWAENFILSVSAEMYDGNPHCWHSRWVWFMHWKT